MQNVQIPEITETVPQKTTVSDKSKASGPITSFNPKNADDMKNLPKLTMIGEGDIRTPVEFANDKGNIEVRNGAIFNGHFSNKVTEKYTNDIVEPGETQIKDGALSFGLNRFRISENNPTETQKILRSLEEIRKSDISNNEQNEIKEIKSLVTGNTVETPGTQDKLKMVNDPVRRAFESYYAKYILEDYFSSPEKYASISAISKTQVENIKKIIPEKLSEKYELAWKNKGFDTDIAGLDQLEGFYERAELTIDTLDIKPSEGDGPKKTAEEAKTAAVAAKNALFDVYKHRYISYPLNNIPEIKDTLPGHWDTVFDPVKAPGKGRIELKVEEGTPFRQVDSYNVGIMRNIDVTPGDLRLNKEFDIQYNGKYENNSLAGASTRCPDRLEMQDPNHKLNLEKDSYMKKLFDEGTGTYVNGPSGSILIEQGALRACEKAHKELGTSAADMEKYLEVQAALFIYVDGGHSMKEISYSLTHENSKKKMVEAFGDDFKNVGDNLFLNEAALTKAARAAESFDKTLMAKDAAHLKFKAVPQNTSNPPVLPPALQALEQQLQDKQQKQLKEPQQEQQQAPELGR